MSRQANLIIVQMNSEKILIRDVGPWDRYLTITNYAEGVVARMIAGVQHKFSLVKLDGRRLFYEDSDGQIDELVVRDGKFVQFGHGGW